MDLGVERLDTSVEHLRESGDLRYLLDLQSVLFQKSVRTSGGYQFDTQSGEFFGEINDSALVRHTDKCSFDRRHLNFPAIRSVLQKM